MSLTLSIAAGSALRWCTSMVVEHHYLHKAPDRRSRPLAYVLRLGAEAVGCLWFGRPEATRCFAGELTYGGQGDVAQGRAVYDRWEILNLSRLWLSPDVQQFGRLFNPLILPGFLDRKGRWRSALASWAIRTALARAGFDYLTAYPPCFVEEPYIVRAVLSYCDTRLHRGAVYQAAGFSLARTNANGIDTWWTAEIADLTDEQNARVRALAAIDERAQKLRSGRRLERSLLVGLR